MTQDQAAEILATQLYVFDDHAGRCRVTCVGLTALVEYVWQRGSLFDTDSRHLLRGAFWIAEFVRLGAAKMPTAPDLRAFVVDVDEQLARARQAAGA